ncbi:MAG: hypothetical protein KC492_26195, partial [Myxococcales bacterium]|nr:hypothetical protein [Myxococcales bacterium]
VTEDYVRAHLRRGASAGALTLPPKLKTEIDETTAVVQQEWEQLTVEMQESLGDLSGRFNDKMNQIGASLQGRLGRMSVHMPALDTKVEIDLSVVFEHQNRAAELQEELRRREEEYDRERMITAESNAQRVAQEERVQHARRRFEQVMGELQSMGPPPNPKIRRETQERNRRGIFGWVAQAFIGRKEVTVEVADYSGVERHQEQKQALLRKQAEREQLIEDEFKKLQEVRGATATRQMAEERAEKELRRAKRLLEKAAQESAEAEAEQVQESLAALKRAGVEALDRPIQRFDGWINGEIKGIFDANLQALLGAAREHYMEPMENKRARLRDIEALLQKGQDEIDARKATLHGLLAQLDEVQRDLGALQQELRKTQGGA